MSKTYQTTKFKIQGNLVEVTSDKWVEIFSVLAPELDDALDHFKSKEPHVACPGHGGKDGFRLYKDDHSGGGVCNTCGSFPSGIQMMAWIYKIREYGNTPKGYKSSEDTEGKEKARQDIAYYLQHGSANNSELRHRVARVAKQLSPEEIKLQEEAEKNRKSRIMKLGEQLWQSSALYDNNIIRYFAGRKLENIELSPLMRFNPQTPYVTDTQVFYYPAMITPVTLVEDGKLKVIGLHRIFMEEKEDGTFGKASVKSPKKILTWGPLEGSCIRLYPLNGSRTLVFSEGIETGVAVNKLTNLPVWPCVTAWGLANVQIPDDVDTILIAQDFDVSNKGQESALALAERVKAAGKIPIIISPEQFYVPSRHPKGVDWDNACIEDFERAQSVWKPYMNVDTPELHTQM